MNILSLFTHRAARQELAEASDRVEELIDRLDPNGPPKRTWLYETDPDAFLARVKANSERRRAIDRSDYAELRLLYWVEKSAREVIAALPLSDDPENPPDINWPAGAVRLRDELAALDVWRAGDGRSLVWEKDGKRGTIPPYVPREG